MGNVPKRTELAIAYDSPKVRFQRLNLAVIFKSYALDIFAGSGRFRSILV
ncbi:hypothetical protein [Merismopedia glauca]